MVYVPCTSVLVLLRAVLYLVLVQSTCTEYLYRVLVHTEVCGSKIPHASNDANQIRQLFFHSTECFLTAYPCAELLFIIDGMGLLVRTNTYLVYEKGGDESK